MTGVVLRCPNCGTVQAAAGECEACHEAQLRYFCTNHTPGLWLESAECARCGARFGEVRSATEPPPVAADPSPRIVRETRPVTRRSPGSWSPRGSGTGDREGEVGPRPARGLDSLLEILASAARSRMTRGTSEADMREMPVRPRGGSCLGRLLLLILLAIAFMVVVPLLLGGAFLGLY